MPSLSDAEWKVMNAVWSAHGQVSARQICDAVAGETGWAYTTVKTLMDRLVQKDALVVFVRRHVSWYRPRLSRQRAISQAARDLARRAFGGAVGPLVHHLVESQALSGRDRDELRRILEAAEPDVPRRNDR